MSKLPRANKELGQHFLTSTKIIDAIISDHQDYDVIIEIGPGPAVLTKHLVKHSLPTYVIERDDRFLEQLQEHLPENKIFMQDALKFDWDEFIRKEQLDDKRIWLVSNLPYNISAPLFISFQKVSQIKYMTLMFQKEVGEKTYFKENTKNQMNSLLALAMNYWDSKLLCKVPPGAFSPPPKVDSIVVSYKRLCSPLIAIDKFSSFEKFLRLLFSQKRKQVKSVLKGQKNVDDFFEKKLGISSTIRAEKLTSKQIQKCFEFICE